MSQLEIIQFLETQTKPLSRRQIAIGINDNDIKVSHSLKRLIDAGEVKFIEIDRNEAKKMLGENSPMRRCRVYFI